MVKIILSLALLLCGMPAAVAAEQCEESACISVYTDNNQIIIEADGNLMILAQKDEQDLKKFLPKVQAKSPEFFS